MSRLTPLDQKTPEKRKRPRVLPAASFEIGFAMNFTKPARRRVHQGANATIPRKLFGS
jgi:hypothetical protein